MKKIIKLLGISVFSAAVVVGCSGDKPAEANKENLVAEKKGTQRNAQPKEALEYKRLPIDVDQFVKNYEAVAMASEGDPLELPDKLKIKEDEKANFIELHKDLEEFPPTVFNLVLNKKDNTLRAVTYAGSDIYTFSVIAGALDVSDSPEYKELIEELLENPASYKKRVRFDKVVLDFEVKNGTLIYSFTGNVE